MKKTILKDDNGKSLEVDLKTFLDHLNEYHKSGISILTQQLMNFIFGADVVVAQSNFGTTMFFEGLVTLPNA